MKDRPRVVVSEFANASRHRLDGFLSDTHHNGFSLLQQLCTAPHECWMLLACIILPPPIKFVSAW